MNKELNEKGLIHKEEKQYFIISLIVSIICYLFLITSIEGVGIYILFTLLTMYLNAIAIANIRANGVRLSTNQFSEIYAKIIKICEDMEIKHVPDVYVVESGGALNAFATKFKRRNMVVLYSDVFELINSNEEDELSFIIAHELAHIKRNHITKKFFILPVILIPFIGNAYSRACEYTCDRIAAYYINNKEASINGLIMLAIGKALFKKVNIIGYLQQSKSEKGFFINAAEKVSTHPPLPKRIHEIEKYFSHEVIKERSGILKWVITGILVMVIAVVGYIGTEFFSDVSLMADNFFYDIFGDSSEESSLMAEAVLSGDTNSVEELINSGVDVNVQDIDGWTPLMWAAQNNDIFMIEFLMQNGADPNYQDYYEETALEQAIYQDNAETVQILISLGADPNMADSTGWTPLMTASSNGSLESVKALLQSGANPDLKDSNNYNSYLYAKKYGYNEIADLIKSYSVDY